MAAQRLAETIERLRTVVEPVVDREGFELVQLKLERSGGKRGGYLLRITLDVTGRETFAPQRDAEGLAQGGVSLDDCVRVSRALGPVLDVEDVIDGPYQLEVSSPGVERPLHTPRDFARSRGLNVRVTTRVPVEGRTFFVAPVLEADDERVMLDVGGQPVAVPYRLVSKAQLDFFGKST